MHRAGFWFAFRGKAAGDHIELWIPSLAIIKPLKPATKSVNPGIEPAARSATEMPKIVFTANIQRHVSCPEAKAVGRTVREVLENVFAEHPQARGYVLDDQSALRKHMTIFVDGQIIRDRARLTDAVSETSSIYVFQALSGG
jgi:molybdopterin converting factor small subunit